MFKALTQVVETLDSAPFLAWIRLLALWWNRFNHRTNSRKILLLKLQDCHEQWGMWSKGQGSSLGHSRHGSSFLNQRLYIEISYQGVAGKITTDRLEKPKWADVSSDSAECGTSIPCIERYTNLNTSISSLLAFVNCSLGCLFSDWILQEEYRYLCELCDITSCKFLQLCVPGVDTILCSYIFQGAVFHPHPGGFYLTCSGLEGSSWGRDAASRTTSA